MMKPFGLGIAAWLVLASGAVAEIPNADNPNAYVQAQQVLDALDFNRRHLVESYKAIGKRDPQWDASAIPLLESCAVASANNAVAKMHFLDGYDEDRVMVRIDVLNELGCDDPIVRYWMAAQTLERRPPPPEERVALARAAYEGLRDSGYSTYRKAMGARLWLGEIDADHPTYPDAVAAFTECFVDLFEDPEVPLDDERFLYHLIDDFEDRMELPDRVALHARAATVETRLAWLRDMMAGDLFKDLAWEARGGGFANTVDEAGWQGFRANLAEAERLYIRAWEARPEYPEAASQMIAVAMGRQTEQERLWFERAVEAQFDYWPAYSGYRWSIRPRWGGSLDQVYAFGVECLDTGRFDTTVPHNFYSAMDDIADDLDSHDYLTRPGVYENYARYLDGKAASPKSTSAPQWWYSKKAAVALRAGRPEEAKRTLEELGDDVNLRAFADFDLDAELAISEAYVHGTPAQEALDQARVRFLSGEPQAGARLLGDAIDDLGPDDPARRYLRHALRLTEFAVLDETGGWIEMTGQPDLAGWIVHGGDWEVDGQGRWVGHSAKRGYVEGLLLKSPFDFGPRVEARATITFLEKNGSANAGLFFDIEKAGSRPHHLNVTVVADKGHAHIAGRWKDGRLTADCPAGDTVTLHVQRWDGRVSVVVDGREVFSATDLPETTDDEAFALGVGGKAWNPGLSVRFDELEVRRLTSPPVWASDRGISRIPPVKRNAGERLARAD